MSDCISREAAIKTAEFYKDENDPFPRIVESLQKLPSIEPERKPGKWIFTANHCWICSKCGTNPLKGTGYTPTRETMLEQWKFCNVCGAENTEAQNGQFELMRWIPIEEKKPEMFEEIIVSYYDPIEKISGVCQGYITKFGLQPVSDYENWPFFKVIAWMPLPDPYEEGGTK